MKIERYEIPEIARVNQMNQAQNTKTMKHPFMTILGILLFSLNLPQKVKAQSDSPYLNQDDFALYLSTDVWIGNMRGAGVSANYIKHDKFSIQVGWSKHIRSSPNIPEDFSNRRLFDSGPNDEISGIEFLAGKAFELTRYKRVRLNVLGGIAFTKFEEPTNWVPQEFETFKETISNPNYTYSYTNSNKTFFVFQPKLEIPFSRGFGFSISGRIATNGQYTSYELGAGLMLGLLRERM